MDEFIVLDPVGEVAKGSRKPLKRVDRLGGKRVGFIWGMHELSIKFWPVLEDAMSVYEPLEVHKMHKNDKTDGRAKGNTWIPAPLSVIEDIASKVDYAVLGVGA